MYPKQVNKRRMYKPPRNSGPSCDILMVSKTSLHRRTRSPLVQNQGPLQEQIKDIIIRDVLTLPPPRILRLCCTSEVVAHSAPTGLLLVWSPPLLVRRADLRYEVYRTCGSAAAATRWGLKDNHQTITREDKRERKVRFTPKPVLLLCDWTPCT